MAGCKMPDRFSKALAGYGVFMSITGIKGYWFGIEMNCLYILFEINEQNNACVIQEPGSVG
jgi:hypothetical protein